MKKAVKLFCAAAVIAMTTGCVDYGCDTYYNVINQTDCDISVDIGSGNTVYKSTKVKSGEERTVYHYGTLCSKGFIADDYFSDEEKIEDLSVTIDGKSIVNDFWKRKYWKFTAVPYKTTFTLTLTKELLAEIGRQE